MGEVVVLDCGTRSTKAGFSGECLPRLVIPTVVGSRTAGRIRSQSPAVSDDDRNHIGCEALIRRSSTPLLNPVRRGIITDWEAMHKIWRGVLRDYLHIDPSNHPILLTESTAEPPRTREMKTEIFFEEFGAPRFSLVTQSVLSLYASGRTSGIVVDIGAGQSSVQPFIQGKSLRQGMVGLNYSGNDITDRLLKSLSSFGFRPSSAVHRDLANDIKETVCSVSLGKPDPVKHSSASYTLPDRTTITLTPTQLTEPYDKLFTGPNSLQASITKAISFLEGTSVDIVLSGGTTDTMGFRDALESLLHGAPASIVKSGITPEARFMPWVGGSVLGTLGTFSRVSLSRAEYEEHGSGLINQRCHLEHFVDNSHVLYEFSGA